jgi:hypothetical protein
MNRLMIGVLLAAVAMGGVAILFFGPRENRRAPKQEPVDTVERAVLSVDDVATRPDQYKRRIAVRGVVSFVSVKDRVAVLISESEFATCGTVCPNVVLPVQWRGELPTVTDHVVVQGEIQKTERGFVFNASHAQIVERGRSHGK